ncbi:MAG TPA: glycosyltransferase, partial [Myxococcota bacterium]|nr:glycosyltransferase [Myxococcota bacterium]
LSTLPALAARLRARGIDAELRTAWDAPFNPYDNQLRLPDEVALAADAAGDLRYPANLAETFANTPARIAHAMKQGPAWLASIDLSGFDVLIAPGFENARAVWTNPTRRPDARLIVPDFHLMSGVQSWHALLARPGAPVADGAWWPGEHVEVHALFPRHVRAYHRAGVPMRQIHWHPYPVHPGHFPAGRPVAEAAWAFTGGSHQRDWRTLAAAVRQLPAGARPLRIHTPDPIPAPLVSDGEVRLLHFHEALANSRYVVLPMVPDERRPAGVSVVSLALAAGRPLVATATHGLIDHLRHGHDAILVPPEDPRALAAAMARLDEDDELLERLAAGARRSASHRTVDAWARLLIEGAPPQAAWTMEPDGRGPWYAWPA